MFDYVQMIKQHSGQEKNKDVWWESIHTCSHPTINANTYIRITSIKSPSFCMITFSASLVNLTPILPQSHDCSYYVTRPILAPPPLWSQRRTDLRAHDFAHSPDLWHQLGLANVICVRSCRLCRVTPTFRNQKCTKSGHVGETKTRNKHNTRGERKIKGRWFPEKGIWKNLFSLFPL